MAGNYQGSQAYANLTGGSESVNRNTGTVNYSKTIVSLRGIVPSIDLNLSVTYCQGIQGYFGLPKNWTFGISFVTPGQSLTIQGRTYLIDEKWADVKSYRSGLKYINNHALKFEHTMPSQALPLGQSGTYGWKLRSEDGSNDYYDDAGKLVMHADRFGNFLRYYYLDSLASPHLAKLKYIQDSWGQKIEFSYQPGSKVIIKGPDQSTADINTGPQGVASVVDAARYTTSFTYTTSSGNYVLSTIRYPSSLQAEFHYDGINYRDLNGDTRRIPAVKDHLHRDSAGTVLSHTQYQFGSSTKSSYTGFSSGYRFGGAADTLVNSQNQLYRYDTLILSLLPGEGKQLSATRVLFNYLHLPVQELHYEITGDGYLNEAYLAKYSYPTSDYARSINYSKPTEVEQLHRQSGEYRGLRRVQSLYDDFGNMIESHEERYDVAQQKYLPFAATANTYTETSWGGSTLSEAIFIDNVSGLERKINYTMTSDHNVLSSCATSYRAGTSRDYSPWKTKSLNYDDKGRITSETVAWSNDSLVPPDSVAKYTSKLSYSLDADGIHTVFATDPKGFVTASKYDLKKSHGPILSKTLPLGAVESFEYDLAGRCVKHTDPLGRTMRTTFSVGATENSSTTTDWKGYIKKTVLDVEGRAVELWDNGDPTQTAIPATATRKMSSTTYDSLSRVTRVIDATGLEAIHGPYDSFGRALSEQDHLGNVTTHVYDDAALTVQQFINGNLRYTTQLDAGGRAVRSIQHPDSSDTSIDYVLETQKEYDASDNVIRTKLWQESKSRGNAKLLSSSNRSFNVDNQISSYKSQAVSDLSPTNNYDESLHNIQYDIFGQVYSRSKDIIYHDGAKYTWQSPVNIYDECKLLSIHRDQLKHEERYSYDGDGHLSKFTRRDGSQVEYEHDILGRMTKMTIASSVSRKTYDQASNKVNNRQTAAGSLAYEYTLDGSAACITYPDGSKQTYTLDPFGRVVGNTDGNGVTRTTVYDDLNRVSSRRLGADDTTTPVYGEACHVKGQRVGEKLVGGGRNITHDHMFDGFGRLQSVVIRDSSTNQVLLQTDYQRDGQGRIKEVRTSSNHGNPEMNCQRKFIYDGFSQLRQDICTFLPSGTVQTTNYTYDGNSNILSVTRNGSTETRTYNAIDQRTDAGFEYDSKGRLTKDKYGRVYSYDDDDRLQEVTSAQGSKVQFQYHPDGSMFQHIATDKVSKLYYDGGSVTAMTTTENGTDKQTSYLMEPGRRILARDGSAQTKLFFDNLGSAAIELESQTEKAAFYDAYGMSLSAASGRSFEFGFQQEFTETSVSGLIYLRSRFYAPDLGCFITRDGSPEDNRYAYCLGDPINHADPTGHSAAATAGGMAAGTAVTLIVAGVATAIFAPEALIPCMMIGAISGAAGSVTGSATSMAIDGEKYTWDRAGEDLLSGALGGLAGVGFGAAAGNGAMILALSRGWSQIAIQRVGFVAAGVIGGFAGSLASGVTNDVWEGRPVFTAETAINVAVGGLVGGVGGAFGARASKSGMFQRSLAAQIEGLQSEHPEGIFKLQESRRMLHFTDKSEAGDRNAWHQSTRSRDGMRLGGVTRVMDTLVIHGDKTAVYPFIKGECRPLKAKLFAQYLADNGWHSSSGSRAEGPIKFASCKGALGNAQILADVLQRPVWASVNEIKLGADAFEWRLFMPK